MYTHGERSVSNSNRFRGLMLAVGRLLARCRRDEHGDGSMFDLVPSPCHIHAADEHEEEDHDPRLLWCPVTVRHHFLFIATAVIRSSLIRPPATS